MSELPLTYRGAVYPWHCDHVGHMNVMYYTGKFDEATWNFFALLGVTPKFLRENGRGMAAVEQKTRYLSELHAGDIVTIRSRLLLLEGKKIRFLHEMVNGETDEMAATSELFGLHLDTEIRKSCPFPDDVQANGRKMIARHQDMDTPGDD
ncbi:MAG: thioesterase family protein [Rhodospirillaceae bacterium]|jgi:acyl-CoA thioester hydrolase|nr:thioesterase family protein [Rhodospirillaceae bacterium]MBT5244272.1 thioesterase family protein [Rhodospirillaceae bacterium]MBT5563633.1 thioesterase family protein [Rhodospirillaceae bacterium]MBT6241463.1 thioesterase family protein [Rhodospirillaceae bacterium]MBT7138834.1 thioesterase family protein [Rhodospirillaceae bacterium]